MTAKNIYDSQKNPTTKQPEKPITTEQKSFEALSLEVNKLCFDMTGKYPPKYKAEITSLYFIFIMLASGPCLEIAAVSSGPIQSSVPSDAWLCSEVRKLPFF